MDIAALGLLSLAGYELAKTKKHKDRKKSNNKVVPQEHISFADGSTGHSNMNHFYKGSQPYGGDVSSTKMNVFTGSNMMEHGTKSCRAEPENLFQPLSGLSHINGAPNVDMKQRYDGGTTMNNVLPFEQKRVGPGMNVTSDVDAKGGFHQYFRVLPQNVGEYKKNNFKQRMIPGKQAVTMRSELPNVEAPNIPTYYEYTDRVPIQSKFDVSAPSVRSDIECKPPRVINSDCYFGHVHNGNTLDRSDQNTSRGHDSSQYGFGGNVSMPDRGSSTNAIAGFIVNDSDREVCNDTTRNVSSQLAGTYVWESDNKLDPTTRSTTNNTEFVGHAHGNTYTTYAKSQGDVGMKSTAREGISSGYEGVAYGYQKASDTREYSANHTQRESTTHSYTGPSNHYTSGPEIQTQAEQYTLKEESIVGYAPGPQNINIPIDASMFNMECKDDETIDTRVNMSKMMGSNNMSNATHMGRVEHGLKIPVENNRNSSDYFSVANIVLKNNPFVVGFK
jgi:hypothetical protein